MSKWAIASSLDDGRPNQDQSPANTRKFRPVLVVDRNNLFLGGVIEL